MGKRIRWLKFAPVQRTTLARVAEGMQREEYETDGVSGFISEQVRATFLVGRFIERFEKVERTLDPFGVAAEFVRVEYQQTAFRLSSDMPQLEVYDGPRTVAPLLNRLGTFAGEGCTSEPIQVDVLSWLQHLEPEITDVCVTNAHVARLPLSEAVSAKVIFSGTQDVRRQAKHFAGGRPLQFGRLDISAKLHGEDIRFDLREDGRATITVGPEDFRDKLREALAEVINNGASSKVKTGQ